VKKEKHIFSNNIDSEALAQFESAMAQDFVVKGALMPDAHKGYSLPIGGVVATQDVILPAWVGYDIGCGMCALKTTFSPSQIKQNRNQLFQDIYRKIPTGFKHNRNNRKWDHSRYDRSADLDGIFEKNGLKQLCSLGSGNHFIEIGFDENHHVWIIVHSGSRNLGHSAATHYMKIASGDGKAREGHFGLMVNSKNGQNYIKDMNFCLEFALENRKQILVTVLETLYKKIRENKQLDFDLSKMINRNHNHAELIEGMWIHRKGATQARKGMLGVVPGNMRDGSFIVEGLGNPDSLWSSSHGAGRTLGRKKAKRQLSLDDFKSEMKGIQAKVSQSTLDESPMAYKNIFQVMDQQNSMVQTLHHVKPIINIKA